MNLSKQIPIPKSITNRELALAFSVLISQKSFAYGLAPEEAVAMRDGIMKTLTKQPKETILDDAEAEANLVGLYVKHEVCTYDPDADADEGCYKVFMSSEGPAFLMMIIGGVLMCSPQSKQSDFKKAVERPMHVFTTTRIEGMQ